MEATYPIRTVVAETGLPASTLRYYEEIDLIAPVARDASGRRVYRQRDLHWLQFVKCMRASGMSLDTLRTFAKMRRDPSSSLPEQLALLEAHQAHIRAQMASLAEMDAFMSGKIARFRTAIEQHSQR